MTETSPRSRIRLLSRDWLDAAIVALTRGGLAAVAIEPIARQLGVTKGSFYHHFDSLDVFVIALVQEWEREGTDAVIAALDLVADPRERFRRLVHVSWERLDHLRAEAALAAAAASGDVRVAPAFQRVTAKRLRYVERLYRASGLGQRDARQRALLTLSAYLGTIALVQVGAIESERQLATYMGYVEGVLSPGP